MKKKSFVKVLANTDGYRQMVRHTYTRVTHMWYRNHYLHREDGPALEKDDGTREWYLYGKLHREDGPAIEYTDGTREWYLNGKRHREDGPAVEEAEGTRAWYYRGIRFRVRTLKGFKKAIQLLQTQEVIEEVQDS